MADINDIDRRLTALEQTAIKEGDSVALKSSRGKYIRDDWADNLGHFDRDEAGEGEHYTIERTSTTPPVPPNPNPSGPLTANGRFFNKGGELFRSKGFTSFKLLNLYEKAQDIGPILNQYVGYNIARIFTYTPASIWGNEAWRFPQNPQVVINFLTEMDNRGFNVELVLCTDDDSSKIQPITDLITSLSSVDPPNLLVEAVNEPEFGAKLNPSTFRRALEGSRLLYTSGIYMDD